MKQLNAFIHVLSSIANMSLSKSPSKQQLNCALFIQFMARLSLLFPHDTYNIYLNETFIHLLQQIITPFTLTTSLHQIKNDSLNYIIFVLICVLICFIYSSILFLVIAGQFKIYDTNNPSGCIKAIYSILYFIFTNLEYWIYLPLIQFLIASIICNNSNSIYQDCQSISIIIISIILFIFTLILVSIQIFLFRTYQLIPDNIFKRKFNFYQLFIILLTISLVLCNMLQSNEFINLIRLLLANCLGIFIIFELYYYCPYIANINQIAFQYGCTYLAFTFILTISFSSKMNVIKTNILFYMLIIICTLIFYLSDTFYEIKVWKILQQRKIILTQRQLYQAQLLQFLFESYYSNQKHKVQWFSAVIHHLSRCKKDSCLDLYTRIQGHGVENNRSTTRTVIHCIFGANLANSQRTQIEFPQLVMIWFQTLQCQQPLPAYLLFKQYYQQSELHSLYFRSIQLNIEQMLKQQIILKQKKKSQKMQEDHMNREISVFDVYQSLLYTETLLPIIAEILELKLKYWERIINGYQHINDFAGFTIRLSESINRFVLKLEEQLKAKLFGAVVVKQFNRISQLKLLSLFYGAIANDMQNCIHCEMEIEEILMIERSYNIQLVTNTTLINQKVVLLSISTIKNRGRIMNKYNIHNFFGYEAQQFDRIENITELMPLFIRKKHSKLLDRYLKLGVSDRFQIPRIVFLQQQDGFLSAAHIRIDNFFDQMNDYVLSASFNKVKENCDFILFDSKGKILGMTKQIFQTIQKYCNCTSVDLLIKYGYIFLFFPEIIGILQSQREELLQDNDVIQIDQRMWMIIPFDVIEYCKSFLAFKNTSNLQSASRSIRSDKEFERAQSEATNEFATHKFNFDENHMDATHILGCFIMLLDEQYIQNIQAYSHHKPVQNSQFQINYMLKFKVLGYGVDSYPYFYMEISDFRKSDTIKSTYMSNQLSNTIQRSYQSSIVEAPTSFVYSNREENIEIAHEDIKIVNEYRHEISLVKLQDEKLSYQWIQEIQNLSAPMSKRAYFENPLSLDRKIEAEINLLDQDFKEIADGSNNQNMNLNQSNEPNESQQQLNSSQKKVQSHQIKKIINKHDGNLEMDVRNSQHSFVTTTSNTRDTTQLIRSIKHSHNLNGILRIILGILCIQLGVQIIYLLTKILITQSHTNEQTGDIDDLLEPYQFQILYERTQIFGWLHFLDKMKIANFSDYINQSVERQCEKILVELDNNVDQSYPTFVKVEGKGLLNTFDVNYVTQEAWKDMHFSVFYFQIYEKLSSILNKVINDVVNQDIILDLIFLNQNMIIQYTLISDLTINLDHLFNQSKADQNTNNTTIFIIFLLILSSLNFVKMIFYLQLLKFQQIILINSCRLSEKQALQLIMRLQVVKEIISKQTTIDWKKVDYFKIIYNQWGEINLAQFSIDEKLFKKSMHSEVDSSNPNRERKKRSHQILNSKIQNTQFSCFIESILIMFTFIIITTSLVGGYQLENSIAHSQEPIQQLTQNFIDFSLDFDRSIVSAFIVKIENLAIPYILNSNLLNLKHSNLSSPIDEILNYLVDHQQSNKFSMQSFYNDLNTNNDLDKYALSMLMNLYNDDLCKILSDDIGFCQFAKDEKTQFIQEFGQYYPQDDNREYTSHGILGQQTQTKKIITENYGYELDNLKLLNNMDELKEFINSANFINGIVQHFTDYQRAYEIFIETLISQTSIIIKRNSNLKEIYFYLVIICITIGIGTLEYNYIKYRNRRLHMIRMGILNMPMEILQDPQMKQFLKIVEKN